MKYDVIVIGSGPAGLSAAIYCMRAGKKVLVIEKDYEGTGQIAYSCQVDNYLGLPGLSGYELGEKFRNHAVEMGVSFAEAEVIGIVKEGHDWQVQVADGDPYKAACVIYAVGATHRKLAVDGEETFAGRGVSYCATCDGAFYTKKDVAVIGGGDTALDDALYLSDICDKVYLVHRKEEFRCSPLKIEKLKQKANVELVLNATVSSVLGSKSVEKVVLLVNGESKELPVNGVFVAIGMEPLTTLVEGIVDRDSAGYILANEDGRTNAEGLFVAGDVRKKELRQAITAASDGACAATAAIAYLNY